jgi:hypothetical protein
MGTVTDVIVLGVATTDTVASLKQGMETASYAGFLISLAQSKQNRLHRALVFGMIPAAILSAIALIGRLRNSALNLSFIADLTRGPRIGYKS